MARRTDAGAVRTLTEQAPTGVRLTVPVGSFIEIAKMPTGRGTAVSAAGPFAVNLVVAVSAVVQTAALRRRIDPLVILGVVVRQRGSGDGRDGIGIGRRSVQANAEPDAERGQCEERR